MDPDFDIDIQTDEKYIPFGNVNVNLQEPNTNPSNIEGQTNPNQTDLFNQGNRGFIQQQSESENPQNTPGPVELSSYNKNSEPQGLENQKALNQMDFFDVDVSMNSENNKYKKNSEIPVKEGIKLSDNEGSKNEKKTSESIFKGVQKYFELSSEDFLLRVKLVINPLKKDFAKSIDEKPDLYGPFWITTYLIFLLCNIDGFYWLITSIIYNQDSHTFAYFSNIEFIAGLLYCTLLILPLVICGVAIAFGEQVGYVKVLCLYGYSNISFLVASL